jgi:PHP-associated
VSSGIPRQVRLVNPGVASIGSSDFHVLPDMAVCRTYLVVDERSKRGVLEAIRNGRTVASDSRGALIGDPALVNTVEGHLATMPAGSGSPMPQLLAASAVLLALAALVMFE